MVEAKETEERREAEVEIEDMDMEGDKDGDREVGERGSGISGGEEARDSEWSIDRLCTSESAGRSLRRSMWARRDC